MDHNRGLSNIPKPLRFVKGSLRVRPRVKQASIPFYLYNHVITTKAATKKNNNVEKKTLKCSSIIAGVSYQCVPAARQEKPPFYLMRKPELSRVQS